jgi:hypothetical protein
VERALVRVLVIGMEFTPFAAMQGEYFSDFALPRFSDQENTLWHEINTFTLNRLF